MKSKTRFGLLCGAAVCAVALGVVAASAASTVVVTPTNTHGWGVLDGNANGHVTYVTDGSAPLGVGALRLQTDPLVTAKADYFHAANDALSSLTELSYSTKQNAPAGPIADASYQFRAFLNGGTSGFTSLVFEPYQNPSQGAIVPGAWQQWDVDAGYFWSTRTVTCSGGTVNGTPGGPAIYTLADITSKCPNAVVFAYGVNVGSNNPGWDVEVDAFDYNGTTYDFEPYQVASAKEECKDGGWQSVKRADGSSFKNQGDCIQYVNTGK